MIIDKIKIESEELENRLFPILKNKIFHVTNKESYLSIIQDGCIKNNRDGKRSHKHPKRDDNYGQKNGLISLFDLSNCDKCKLQHVTDGFYFYNPGHANNNPHFFITKDEVRKKLISWQKPAELIKRGIKTGTFIHYGEYYYPDKLPLGLIEKVIIIDIKENNNSPTPSIFNYI